MSTGVSRWAIVTVVSLGAVSFAALPLAVLAAWSKPELTVEIAGCDMVHAPPPAPHAPLACKLGTGTFLEGLASVPEGPRRLRLWIKTVPAGVPVQISIDGRQGLPGTCKPLPGAGQDEFGPQEVEVHEGASVLRVTAGTWIRSVPYSMPLLAQDPSPDQALFDHGLALRQEGKLTEARHVFEDLSGRSDPVLHARATGRLARLVYGADPNLAIRLAYAATAMDAQAGLVSDQIVDTFFLRSRSSTPNTTSKAPAGCSMASHRRWQTCLPGALTIPTTGRTSTGRGES